MTNPHTWYTIAVITLVTALLRFLPFAIFDRRRKTPAIIDKLSRTLPCAVIGMLVIYCLKDTHFNSTAGYLPAVIASLFTGLLHAWLRNTLVSVLCGTVCYMVLVQFLF